jgi:hypothetical protein
MKAILEFKLPEDEMEYNRAVKATDAFLALWAVAQDIFRPARKHGYPNNPRLNELLDSEKDSKVAKAVSEAIGLLETQFYIIVNDHGVNPSDNLE